MAKDDFRTALVNGDFQGQYELLTRALHSPECADEILRAVDELPPAVGTSPNWEEIKRRVNRVMRFRAFLRLLTQPQTIWILLIVLLILGGIQIFLKTR